MGSNPSLIGEMVRERLCEVLANDIISRNKVVWSTIEEELQCIQARAKT